MTDLHLDFSRLQAAAMQADRIRNDFDRARAVAHETAELTGHEGLAARVREFADSWDISRARLSEHLSFLSGALRATVETFEQLDLDLTRRFGHADGVPSPTGGGAG